MQYIRAQITYVFTRLRDALHARSISVGGRTIPASQVANVVPLVLVVAVFGLLGSHMLSTSQATTLTNLRVSGNRIVNGSGETVRLMGVNDSGTEYACIQGWGIFDGPATDASVKAITNWKANVVRVPLNETCWLGINGAPAAYSGANYQNAIRNYVNLLTQNGMAVILELHWAAPGTLQANKQVPMPNRDHSPEFWRQVATAYKGNGNVIFDLYNEPFPDNNTAHSSEGWRCWRDGGTCAGMTYQVAGMQELTNAVRSTSATNIIMLGGLQYANSLSRWLEYKPSDPLNNTMAAAHIYNFNRCITTACYDAELAPIVQKYPLIIGEIGPDENPNQTCQLMATGFSKATMDWLDGKGQSYVAWNWDAWANYCHALITNHDGTPTPVWGQYFKSRLAAANLYPVAPAPSPTPDTTAPTVSITSPTWGQTIAGTINVAMNASDNIGVVRVELKVDGAIKATDTTAPYSIPLDTTTLTNASHTLQALAYDAAGNSTGSNVVSVNVSNVTAPQLPDVTITSVTMTPASPKAGDRIVFTATVKNQGAAATPAGVPVGVGFFVDGVQTNWASRGEMAPGETAILTATNSVPVQGYDYWTATEGAHRVEAFVDDVNRFTESNETNNKLTLQFSVAAATTALPGDVNLDGRVNALDLSVLLARDGQNYPPADFNKDGTVGAADMAILIGKWTW